MRQLKPQDAQFLFMEDGHVAAHVTSLGIFDQSTAPGGLVRFKEIVARIEKRLHDSPLYSQRLMRLPFDLDFPYWVEDRHFEIEYHVRHSRLPEPSDWRQLCIQVARMHSRTMDMNRPPWEVHVIEGLDNVEGMSKGSFAVVTKLHHAAVDGASATQFLARLMDLGPSGPPLLPAPSGRNLKTAPDTSPMKLLRRAAMNNSTAPIRMARAVAKNAPAMAREAAMSAMNRKKSGRSVPETRFNGEISPNRAFDGVTFELADFKMIAKSFGEAKINDVVLATVGGALRRYLAAKKELPDPSLIVTAPMNLRGKGKTSSGADGNNITSLSLPIYTNIANPVDRLKAIVKATQAAKSAKTSIASRMTMELSKHVPPPVISALGPVILSTAENRPMANAIVSNVAGFQVPVYLCGAKMIESYGLAPIGSGMGLFIAVPSYAGKLSFGITTTRQIMPDTPVFMDCLRVSLEELKSAAVKKRAAAGTKAKSSAPRKMYHRTRAKGASSLPERAPRTKLSERKAAAERKAPAARKTAAPKKSGSRKKKT